MAYLAERYAHLLSKEDVMDLFQNLMKAYGGNISEASRKCGIQRKTVYDWSRARSMRLSTKKKVLETLIKSKPERTLDFILTRSKETAVEILSIYLSNVYSRAMAEGTSPQSFVDAIKRFEKIKNKHVGLIWELEEELGNMTYHLREKALNLRLPLPAGSVDTIRPSYILEMVPAVVDAISRGGYRSLPELATSLNVPEKLVQIMTVAIKIPFYDVQQDITSYSELPFAIDELPPTANAGYPNIYQNNENGPSWEI